MAVSPGRFPSRCLSVSISQLLFLFINRAAVIVPCDRPGATLTINKRLFSLCVGRAKKKQKWGGNGQGGEERRAEEEKWKKGCSLTRQTKAAAGFARGLVGGGDGGGFPAREQSSNWAVGSAALDWKALGGRGAFGWPLSLVPAGSSVAFLAPPPDAATRLLLHRFHLLAGKAPCRNGGLKSARQLGGNMADRGRPSHNLGGRRNSFHGDGGSRSHCCAWIGRVFVLCEVSGWRVEWGCCEPPKKRTGPHSTSCF